MKPIVMEEATLTSKSQLTLPKNVREALGVGPGDTIHFIPMQTGYRVLAGKGDISRFAGRFAGRRKTPLSIEEMDRAIAEAAVARSSRT